MSQDRPTIDNILRTVRDFLDTLMPKLEGEPRYHTQVSSYLLGICEREVLLRERSDAEEHAEMTRFLGHDGALPDLTQELCERIRSGAYDNRWDEVMDLVLTQTIRKLRIVRPDHLDPMHREGDAASAEA